MEQLLITKADIQEYIEDVPVTLDEKRLATYIREAQRSILKPLLTSGLYAAYVEAAGAVTLEAPYLALNEYLKPVLVYHAWADYVLFSQGTATAYSYVRKTDPRSEPLDSGTLTSIHKRLKSIGNSYAADLTGYLRMNRSEYPLYETNTCNPKPGYAGGDTMQRI